jgi:prolyl oligopeptidase
MAQFSATYPNSLQHPELTSKKDFHGTEIVDKFAWLEDPNSADVKTWVDAQNAVTESYLNRLDFKPKMTARMTELYNYEKLSCPFKRGKYYYYFRNSGLQNQSVLYQKASLTSEPSVFFDVNTLSEDGTTAISTYSFSESGDYFAYGLSKKGSDWVEIQLQTVDPAHPMASKVSEKIEWVKFSGIQWTLDDAGFFYSRFPKPATLEEGQSAGSETEANLNHAVYYHRIGTSQDEDYLICRTPDHPKWTMGATVSDDGEWVFITIHEGAFPANLVWYARRDTLLAQAKAHKENPATNPEPTFVKLIDNFDAEFSYLTNDGPVMYFQTNFEAPRYRIISIDMEHSEKEQWKDIIPESKTDVLSWAAPVDQNKLIVVHIRDVADVMDLHHLNDGKHIREIELATLGTVVSISARKEQKEFFYKFSSYLHPGSTYHFNFAETDETKQLNDFGHTKIPGYDASQFETKRLFCTAKDGTKIPVFVVHKKGIVLDGSNPTLLYGYGGFNVAIQPYFSSFNLVWMQSLNGVFAVANIRGGAEYGEEWHKAGIKEKKQNVFDDFQAAAEYLISEKYTRKDKLAIFGGSNGGLLVGACINQRPDLYGAAVAAVGVMDMLNFHRYTIGHAWTTDYGCADNAEDFKYLIKYSPLHNVNASATYPATFLTTADHDDRVVPLHTYKFIAALQTALPNNPNPLLVHVDTKSGHSAGKPTSKVIEEKSDLYAFLALALNISWSD